MSEKKKPLLQEILDEIEEAVKPRYNPSGFRDAAMDAEDVARKQKAITLLGVLKASAFSERQREVIHKRLHGIRGGSAFPDLGRYFDEVMI